MAKKCKKCKYYKEHKKKKHIFKVAIIIINTVQGLATVSCMIYETFFK